jgi:hypothetical protein
MRQIGAPNNPYTLRNEAAKVARRNETNSMKFRMFMRNAHDYLVAEHEYQLFRGDTPFGKPKTMLGSEAREENKRLEDKYWADLSTKEGARLWRWRTVQKTRLQRAEIAHSHK